jgi:immunoglobulin-like protein involved in spore germination
MTVILPPDQDRNRPAPGAPQPSPRARRWATATALVATAAVGIAAVALGVALHGGGAAPGPAAPVPATSAAPAPTTRPTQPSQPTQPSGGPTTTAPATAPSVRPPTTRPAPTTPPPAVPADAATAVWPTAASGVRYRTPQAAARGFAVGLAGMRDPHLSGYRAADARSGEVDVRPGDSRLPTHVVVRELGDGTWWVLGSATDDITLDSPATGDRLAPPSVTLTGSALAFEGTVFVRVVDDRGTTLGTGTVVGGGDVRRPFTGTVALAAAGTDHGALVLGTQDMREGLVSSAAVVRISFDR